MSLFKNLLLPTHDLLSSVWCHLGFLEHVRHCVELMLGLFLLICPRKTFVDGWHDFVYEPVIEDYGGVLIAWFKSVWLVFVVYANTQCQCEQILPLCKTWKTVSGKKLLLSSDSTLAMCADISEGVRPAHQQKIGILRPL